MADVAASEAEQAAAVDSMPAPAIAANARLFMATTHDDNERLKELLVLLMSMAAASNEAEQAAARDPTPAPEPAAILDPQLIMAARRGDCEQLRDLLGLNDDEEHAGTVDSTAVAMAAAQQVIVEVVRQPAVAAAAPVDPTAMPMAAAQRVDRLPAAAASGLLDGVTRIEGDSLLHVVASCGDGDEFLRCARIIHRGRNSLLVARNKKRETPLHCAAGAGNANMVSCLVALATAEAAGGETALKEFLRMQNVRGETALHQAVQAGSKTSMDKLMSVDAELACVPREEDVGNHATSPLYLAISLGKMDIAEHLIHKSNRKLSCSGPDGRSVLHAAVSRGQALPMLMELFKDVTVDVHQEEQHVSNVPLLSQLAIQRDKDGNTPLHLAASMDGRRYSTSLSQRFRKVWPSSKSTTTLLLDANTCSVYQPDNEGMYPIHVAALAGSIDVVKVLLKRFPDCATLRDAKGRTFLHVATDWEGLRWISRNRIVEYACRQPKLSSVLNVQDNNGDTALHRAVHVGNMAIVNSLVGNRQVDLSIPNKDDLTPLDLSWSKIPSRFYYMWNPRSVILISLILVGAPCGGSRADLLLEQHVIAKIDEDKESQNLTNATQVMGVVSVLVATVSFASAFSLPGGYHQSADDGGIPGTPVLARSYAFGAFVVADVLAFICSSLATFSLVFAGVPAMDVSIRYKYVSISALLLHASARSLVAAFVLGLYAAMAPVDHTIAVAICVISFAALPFGNMALWQLLCVVYTAWARLGIQILATWWDLAPAACAYALLPFLPFIVIFGLPVIRKLDVAIIDFDIFVFVPLVILVLPAIRRIMARVWK
ncbi:hypothetical protein ACP70R_042121 [Stipagrostis hirtigluma subsp. patula]